MGDERVAADLVVRNAKACTMDETRPWASAFAVRGGRLVAIGSNQDVEPLLGSGTEVVDADGKTVLPGLIDCHAHAFEGARADLYEVPISPAADLGALIDAAGSVARKVERGQWVKGAGWSVGKLIDVLSQKPALAVFDEATGDRPTVLRDSSHHAVFANSAAMRMAGVTPDSVGKSAALVGKHADGGLSGLFFETACELIDKAIPLPSDEQRRTIARRAAAIYHGFGVTGFVQAATSEVTLDAYRSLDRDDDLNVWIAACIATNTLITPEREGVGAAVIARRNAYRSAHVAVDFVKFFMDGVPGARTASFHDPYRNPAGGSLESPPPFHSAADLYDLMRPLDADGIQVKVHAVGDRAIRETLDAFEAVREANGPGPQHSIAHLSYIAEEEIPRLARLNVAADFCPALWFPNPILHANDLVLADGRGAKAWPIGDVVRSGALSMLGTDWPIAPTANPWLGLAGLVTRSDPRRETPGVFRPKQALTLAEALPLCTINVARHMGFERETGSLSLGKSADFILLDRDLFAIEPEAIADTIVRQTYFGGRALRCA